MPSELEAGDIQLPPPQRPEQPAQRAAAPYVRSAIDAVWNTISGPRRAMQQEQPKAGQMWSDEQEAIRQANAAGELRWGAQTGLGMVGTPALTGGVPADALGSGARALFDYSRLHEVPNVPQSALQRVQPARGTPQKFLDLAADKERIAAANKLVGKGARRAA